MKTQALIAKLKVYFGQDELTVRRAGLDSIKPKLTKGCSMDVKHFDTHDLYIFTPEKLKTDGAVVYYHGGGFTAGSSNDAMYNATILSNSTNTVIVSINYRLEELQIL